MATTRRHFLAGALSSLGLAGCASMESAIESLQPPIAWRDMIIFQNFTDPALQQKIEGFLDFFEKGSFPYEDAAGPHVMTGQDIVKKINRINLKRYGTETTVLLFQIDMPYDTADPKSGAELKFLIKPTGTTPVIFINTDYLRGAKYPDRNGALHPLPLDVVLTSNLMAAAYYTDRSVDKNLLEDAVLKACGAPPREGRKIVYEKDSNGGYVTLSDKCSVTAAPAPAP